MPNSRRLRGLSRRLRNFDYIAQYSPRRVRANKSMPSSDAHHLHRDPALARSAINKSEMFYVQRPARNGNRFFKMIVKMVQRVGRRRGEKPSEINGGRTRTRTLDPLIKSQLLYQLSYAPGMPLIKPRQSGSPSQGIVEMTSGAAFIGDVQRRSRPSFVSSVARAGRDTIGTPTFTSFPNRLISWRSREDSNPCIRREKATERGRRFL